MKIFLIQLIISVLFSLQQNPLDSIPNDKQIKVEDIKNEIKNLNLESAISKISGLFQDQIFNLTEKINNLINSTLKEQDKIIDTAISEQIYVKDLLSEINSLKQRYRRNMIFSYILGSFILITFVAFYCNDCLKRRKENNFVGYKNPGQSRNANTQLDIV